MITGRIGKAPSQGKISIPDDIVKAHVPQSRHGLPKDRVSGYMVHASCWDLLCTHKVWELTGADKLDVLWGALWDKCIADWNDEGFDDWKVNFSSPGMEENLGFSLIVAGD